MRHTQTSLSFRCGEIMHRLQEKEDFVPKTPTDSVVTLLIPVTYPSKCKSIECLSIEFRVPKYGDTW